MPIYRIQQGERLMKKTKIIVMVLLAAFLFSAQNATALSKARVVISPYFQTDVDSTYTFMGVSHPSLTTAVSSIGLTVATVGSQPAASSTFTINAAETYRIFIVSTNHSTINSSTITGNEVIFLSMTTGASQNAAVTFLSSKREPATAVAAGGTAGGFAGLNMLSIWGAVVIPGTTSGFAMEFVGDAHDSNSIIPDHTEANIASDNQMLVTIGRGLN